MEASFLLQVAEEGFRPDTAVIGGLTILTIHLAIMAMLRKRAPDWHFVDKLFDFLNFPMAFILVAVATPPWPIYSFDAWQTYVGNAIALAVAASISASKVIQGEKDKSGKELSQAEAYQRAADQSRETEEKKEPPPE